jgi:hypothetical protein
MGRGGFPPSETGSFSAHHTAQRVGLLFGCQLSVVSSQSLPRRNSKMNKREKSRAQWESEFSEDQYNIIPADGSRVGHIMAKRSTTPAPIPDFAHLLRYLLSGVFLVGAFLVFSSELPHKITIGSATLAASLYFFLTAFRLTSKKRSSV